MVYMGGRAKNNASRANQASHYAVMGGIAPQRGVRRFMLRRARNRQTIPALPKPGLQYMRDHDILSRNPVGSGGIGRMKNIVDLSIGVSGHGGDFGASGGDWDKGPSARDCTAGKGANSFGFTSACGFFGIGGETRSLGSAEPVNACCITNGKDEGGYPIGTWPEEAKKIGEDVDGLVDVYHSLADNQVNMCVAAPCGEAWSQIGPDASDATNLDGPSGNPISLDLCNKLANVPMQNGVPLNRNYGGEIARRGWSGPGYGVLDWLREQNYDSYPQIAETLRILNDALPDSSGIQPVFPTNPFTEDNVETLKNVAFSGYGRKDKYLSLYDHCACAPVNTEDASGFAALLGTPSQLSMKKPYVESCADLGELYTAEYNRKLRQL